MQQCGYLKGAAILVAGAMFFSSSAFGTIEVIYSQVAGAPSNAVPSGAGVPAGTQFNLQAATGFDRPFRSRDATQWIFRCQTNLASTENEILIVGSGTTGTTVLREGVAAPWAPAELAGLFRTKMGINDAGHFVFGNNTSGVTTADEYIVKYDGANYVIIAQEGQPVPGVAGEAWGGTLDSAHITHAGSAGFVGPGTAGALPTTHDGFCMLDSTIVEQEGDVPAGQMGGGTLAWEAFNQDDFFHSADGAYHMIRGNLTGTVNDDILVINGTVVLQEGFVIPGSGFTSPLAAGATGLTEHIMNSYGDWFCRGSNVDLIDWVVRNGFVIAKTDDPITPGNTELYDDATFAGCFFFMQGNNNGAWVVGGVTNAVDLAANAVLVLNGDTVIARENDMVDINGDGMANDDAFLSVFNNDDGFLTDDGLLYFLADLRNGAGTFIGQAFMRINTAGNPCPADIDPQPSGNGVVDIDDLLLVIGSWGPCVCPADINASGAVDIDDLLIVIGAWGPCP